MVAGGGFEPPISRRGVDLNCHRSRGISARAYEPRGISGYQRGFVIGNLLATPPRLGYGDAILYLG